MTNLKFYKMAQAPVGTTEMPLEAGAIWFDSSNHVIKVFDGADWAAYSGVIDASVAGEVLTIKKWDNSTVSVDFSIYATDEALNLLSGEVTTLKGTVASHGTSITDLQGRMTTVEGKASAAEGKLAGLTGTVVEDIAAAVLVEENRAKGVESGLDTRLDTLETKVNTDHEGRIAGLEAKFTGEDSVADQIAEAVEAAEGRVQAKLDNKVETSAYNQYVSDNDERVGAVEDAVEAEAERAAGVEAGLQEQIGEGFSKTATIAAAVKSAQDAADAAQETIDNFLTGEGIDPNKVENLKEIVKYIEDHGAEYSALVEDLGDLSDAIDTLNGKVDVEKVSTAIATAKGEAVTAANGYADGLIEAEILRADGAYDEKGAADAVKNYVDGELAKKLDKSTFETFKTLNTEAIAAAVTSANGYTDGKVTELNTAIGKKVDTTTYEGYVATNNAAVKANADAITALQNKVADTIAWTKFE